MTKVNNGIQKPDIEIKVKFPLKFWKLKIKKRIKQILSKLN